MTKHQPRDQDGGLAAMSPVIMTKMEAFGRDDQASVIKNVGGLVSDDQASVIMTKY
jgi:hypothetical protein